MADWATAWDDLCRRLSLPSDVAAVEKARIFRCYSETHRHYHTLTHIDDCVTKWRDLRDSFAQPDTALLALFYHDIVYDPARQDNEQKSAQVLERALCSYLPQELRRAACLMIEATASHDATDDADTNLLLDIDMSIIAADPSAYDQYAKDVQAEFEPVYGRQAYLAGRLGMFLEPALRKSALFVAPSSGFCDETAWANLRRERDRIVEELSA